MTWAEEFRRKQYLQGSLWLGPLLGGLAGILLGSVSVLDRPPHEHARVLAVLGFDRDVGALGGGRRHCGAHGLRRDGERARGADDDGDVLGPLHAALVPELDPEGCAHRADRHADAVVHASPARRGRLRAEPGRHDGRAAAVRVRAAVRRLLRRLPAPDAARRGRSARRRRGTEGVRGQRADLGRSGRSVPRHRGLPVIRRAGARRTQPSGRRDPGDPRKGSHELRAGARLPARPATCGRRLRPGRCDADPGVRRRAVRSERRGAPGRASRARDRANDRAGSGVRDPGDGRHREQGALGRRSTTRRRRFRSSTISARSCA